MSYLTVNSDKKGNSITIIYNTFIHILFLNLDFAYKPFQTKSTIESRKTSFITHVHFIPDIIDNLDKVYVS